MTDSFIPVFFPDLGRSALYQLFPKALCSDPAHLELGGSYLIKWPYLAPLCVLGVLVGLGGALSLRIDRYRGSTVHASWISGFFFFGLMNITAIMSHCLLQDVHSRAYTIWRALDVGCTGASSLSCMHAAASAARQVLLGREPTKRKSRTALMVLGFNMGLMALSIGGNIRSVPWTNEIIYLALFLLCIPVVGLDLAVAWSSASWDARGWSLLAVLGLLLCAVGQPLETILCDISGSNINAVHCLFAGCDVMFVGLAGYLKLHNRAQWEQLAQQRMGKQD